MVFIVQTVKHTKASLLNEEEINNMAFCNYEIELLVSTIFDPK